MGAMKDLVDLCQDLESRARNHEDIALFNKIQSLTLSLQSDHAEMLERDVRLIQENAELKKRLSEIQAEEIIIREGIEFRRGPRTLGEWLAFCPKCHLPAHQIRGNEWVQCTAVCGWQVKADLPRTLAIIGGMRTTAR